MAEAVAPNFAHSFLGKDHTHHLGNPQKQLKTPY